MPFMADVEAYLRGPVAGVPALLQPVAHALVQARDDVARTAESLPATALWTKTGAASAGFHLLHLAGALDRLFTYARGSMLDEAQKTALRAESQEHPEMDGAALSQHVSAGVDRALHQLRETDAGHLLEHRTIGRAQLPTNVLGLLFHAAEHTTRHVGQFITTVKIASAGK
jgi:hypothetical protein